MIFRFKVKDFHISSLSTGLKQTLFSYSVISLLVAIAYIPTFSGDFILDDNPLIKNNPYVKRAHSLSSYLGQEDGVTDVRRTAGNYHTGYYRPLINLSYWVDYRIWGMEAPGFRATNLLLHLLTCLVLYHLILLFVNDQKAALLAALLFSAHPVNTESVSWITSRNNILVTLFSLLSFYFFIKAQGKIICYKLLLPLMLFALAQLSKEFSLMLLPIMFLYQRLVGETNRDIRKELLAYLSLILIVVMYLFLKQSATGSFLSPGNMDDLWPKVYFAPYIIVANLICIFFPYRLHSFTVGYPISFWDWKALGSILVLLLLGVLLWKKRNHKGVVFSILSFIVSLFPVLNLIRTSAYSLIAMRWLYFPMSFLFIAVAWGIQESLSKRRSLALTGFSLILVYFTFYSYTLNETLWQNEKEFFHQEVLQFDNPLYYSGLAEIYLDEKKYGDSEKYFRKALKKYPGKARHYINYSALLIDTDRSEVALSLLNKAKPLPMTYEERGEWFNNAGMAQFKLKNREEALKSFRKAVVYRPDQALFWGNLGGAYGAAGDYRNSISSLKRGLEIAPDSVELRKNLAITYMRIKDYQSAIETLEKVSAPERSVHEHIRDLLLEARRNLSSEGH
jgi:tetratricopeptide (TPR) repeat protein